MNQIALYDKAWDSIMQLPKNIQKRIPEFLEKFRTNSKDPSLHLEPISTFADPQLRTARVNKQYRAIIHAPTSGNLYHLLYIDNHDEAMAWAERKVFKWNDFTQSYQVFARPGDATVKPLPTVDQQTYDEKKDEAGFADQSDQELLRIGVPEVLLPSVREIHTIEELEGLYDYLPIEALENLSLLLEGSAYHTIVRDVEEGKVDSEDRTVQEQSANNQRSFFELTDDDLLNRMLAGEVSKWRVFLHPSQQRLVEGSYNGPTKVTGGAGTGKTVAALHRAKILQERGAASYSQPILFTTYTRSLSANLREELDHLGVDLSLVHLYNIDHFVVNKAKEIGLLDEGKKILDLPGSKKSAEMWTELLDFHLSANSAEFLHEEYRDVILHQGISSADEYYHASRRGRRSRVTRKDKVGIWKMVEAYNEFKDQQGYVDLYEVYNMLAAQYDQADIKPYRHIIADELQDFSNVHLRLLRALVAEQSDDLFLVGDPLQQIYGRRIVFSEAGINVRGRRSRKLKINYRTTEQIKQAAVSVIEDVDFSDFEDGTESKKGYVSLRSGNAPTYEVFKTGTEEHNALIQTLIKYLFPKGQEPSVRPNEICIATRTKKQAKPFRAALHSADIPYYDLTEKQTPTGNRDGVWVSTFHNLKGLEFKVVFLVDVSADTFPYRHVGYNSLAANERRWHDEQEKALMYVAMTRAISQVHISGVGKVAKPLALLSVSEM